MKCINLKKRYPHLKVEREAEAESSQDPWLYQLICIGGHISPDGPDTFWFSTNSRLSKVARRFLAERDWPHSVTVIQDGDDGISGTFHKREWKYVTSFFKPKRR